MSTASSGASADGAVPVSVVIPCYNAQFTLRRALASVAAQSARVLEVIAVDDASTDGTGALLAALQAEHRAHWLKVIRFERNGGVAAAASQPALLFSTPTTSGTPTRLRSSTR